MLTSLKIQGFRSLKSLELNDLGRCNLIVGPLNAGKTSLLEAIFCFCATGNPVLLYRLLGLRRVEKPSQPSDTVWDTLDMAWTLPHNDKPGRRIQLTGNWNDTKRRVTYRHEPAEKIEDWRAKHAPRGSAVAFGSQWGVLMDTVITTPKNITLEDRDENNGAVSFSTFDIKPRVVKHSGAIYQTGSEIGMIQSPEPNLPARWLSPSADDALDVSPHLWEKVEVGQLKEDILAMLRSLDSSIEDVSIGAHPNKNAYMRIKVRDRGWMPLAFQGSGLAKAVAAAANFTAAKDGILLIDEIDASLHVDAQLKLIRFILKAAKEFNVQLFVTTHSLETVDLFLAAADDCRDLFPMEDLLRLIQLRRDPEDGVPRASTSSLDKARWLRDEVGLDPRLLP